MKILLTNCALTTEKNIVVLRAKYLLLCTVFFWFLGLNAHANSQPYCIGRGDDPSKDFYAKKIDKLIEESKTLNQNITALENRLSQIDKEIENHKTNKIPKLFREFETNPLVKTHPTLKTTFTELKKYFYQHELQQADMLIANKKAEKEFKEEQARIVIRTNNSHRAYAQTNRILIEGISKEQSSFEREYPKIDDKVRRAEEDYRDRKFKLAKELRTQLTPAFWKKTLSRNEIEVIRKQHEQEKIALTKEELSQITPLRKERAQLTKNYLDRISEYKKKIQKEKEIYNAALENFENESRDNRADYENSLKENRSAFGKKVETDNSNFDSRVQAMKAALSNDPNPRVREIAKSDGIMDSVNKEKIAIDQLINEKKQIPITLQNLRKEKEKYKLLSLWWKEQGEAKDSKQTEFGVCENCDILPKINAITEALKVPHLKLECVEASIKIKKAYSEEIMCDDSHTKVGETKNICVTKRMADYTQWALNNALDCLSSPSDPIDPQTLYRKLNNESTFRFFHAYNGGQGLMQTVTIAQKEMLGMSSSRRSEGRKYLSRVMNQNSKKCDDYSSIIDFRNENRYDKLQQKGSSGALNEVRNEYPLYNKPLFNPRDQQSCDFVSLQDGIHRSVISGIGLYMYYRTIADSDLENLYGSDIKKNPQYKKIRDLATLAYYGPNGPGGAKQSLARLLPSVKATSPNLSGLKPNDFEKILAMNITYIKSIQRSEDTINSSINEDKLQCVE